MELVLLFYVFYEQFFVAFYILTNENKLFNYYIYLLEKGKTKMFDIIYLFKKGKTKI
jgi:hypothetical protein